MSLSWIKLHANLPEHPKADLLECELRTPRAWTFVVQLWLWAAKVRPSGDLSGLPASIVARRAGWDGDADVFVAALRTVGFLDGDVLHDWDDEQGAHQRKAERDRERQRTAREARRSGTAKPSGATPQPVARASRDGRASVAGERRGEERREERESAADATPPAAPAQAGASSPSSPTGSPKPSGGPPQQRRRFGTRLPHEMELWRDTPEALLDAPDPEMPQVSLSARLATMYPALDGRRGRPTVLSVVKAKFPAFETKFFAHGPASAFPALVTWVGEGYRQHLFSFEKDGNVDPESLRQSRDARTGSAPVTARARPVDDPDDDLVSA